MPTGASKQNAELLDTGWRVPSIDTTSQSLHFKGRTLNPDLEPEKVDEKETDSEEDRPAWQIGV